MTAEPKATARAHEALRPLMSAIAYRMTGSVSEAEDIAQEAFLRLHRAEADEAIASPRAYLAAVTTRLSIDHLRSARVRRERYVGTWLPEPVLTGGDDAAESAELAESVSLAFLVLLETLSPVERAVFLLHDVFDYPYDEIAAIVGKSEANCRQLASRARRRLEERRPRFEPSPERRDELARRFLAACADGNVEALEKMLAEDVVVYGDGGGNVPGGWLRPIEGRERVARLLLAVTQLARERGLAFELVEVNGQPGALVRDGDGLVAVLALDVDDERIAVVRSIVNPDKLRHLGPLGDPGWFVRR